MIDLSFKPSEPLTLGVELELQLVDRRDGNLTRAASDIVRILEKKRPDLDIKLEITESMLEIATHVQRNFSGVHGELRTLRDVVCETADRLDVGVCGGGTHAYQHWADRRIADKPRFKQVAGLYGYLAKQFTVFGQHVHIGCPDGDGAMRLLHGLSRYVPQFIALAAASPFQQGCDTSFDCSRMNTVSSFPLAGRAPFVLTWDDFTAYFSRMHELGIVQSMKDFYWDIRPKPEYGTVEIRVFDTPLTIRRAAALAIYAQSIARMLMEAPPFDLHEDIYLVYGVNRFQACRFGLDGQIVDAANRETRSIADDVRLTLKDLRERTDVSGAHEALDEIARCLDQGNHASWLRRRYAEGGTLEGVVFAQTQAWQSERVAREALEV